MSGTIPGLFGGVDVVLSIHAPAPTVRAVVRKSHPRAKRRRWQVVFKWNHRYLFDGDRVYIHPASYDEFVAGFVPANAMARPLYTGPRPVAPSDPWTR